MDCYATFLSALVSIPLLLSSRAHLIFLVNCKIFLACLSSQPLHPLPQESTAFTSSSLQFLFHVWKWLTGQVMHCTRVWSFKIILRYKILDLIIFKYLIVILTIPKVIYRCNTIPIKIPMAFFTLKKKRKIPKFCIEEQKIQIAEAIIRKKATLPDFKLYYKLIVIKTVLCWIEIDT